MVIGGMGADISSADLALGAARLGGIGSLRSRYLDQPDVTGTWTAREQVRSAALSTAGVAPSARRSTAPSRATSRPISRSPARVTSTPRRCRRVYSGNFAVTSNSAPSPIGFARVSVAGVNTTSWWRTRARRGTRDMPIGGRDAVVPRRFAVRPLRLRCGRVRARPDPLDHRLPVTVSGEVAALPEPARKRGVGEIRPPGVCRYAGSIRLGS
jgi:hypothetical protein